ncbi:MAG: ABC transporter ATP-binding protein [Chitinispirillaceae bacterium]|nr:ABC transporter ATP-binding protein [Chitinispirillaceae bacterium]
MNVIEIRNLHKVYNATSVPVNALNGITLTIEEGEFTAIVGPSGSGKTTLLNIMGGLDTATQGEVVVAGRQTGSMKPDALTSFRLATIGFVFQSYNLVPVLTAKENVMFIMQLQGRSKSECEKRTHELLSQVGLADRGDSRPSQLSGGQQQRVAVARALAPKPRFILADEPTANLDSASTLNLLEIMERLNREERITFVFSTHDQRVVDTARRVVTIRDGVVVGDEKKN